MTDDNVIFNDFKAIEAMANSTTRGADYPQIIAQLAAKYDRPAHEISQLSVKHTISGPC